MPRERTFCKAILSPNNKILLIGGTDSVYQTVSQIDMYFYLNLVLILSLAPIVHTRLISHWLPKLNI